ncbi:MAG: hypothetical protein LC745_06345, partial [Planctomycetia bacterium]|nr:hypothetical protein [Planctomycetia bacterium]
LHTEEAVDPSKLGPGLKRWADRSDKIDPALRRIPATALAASTAFVDSGVLLDALLSLAPGDQKPKIDNLLLALDGLLSGLDTRKDVVPRLGPGVLAYVEGPDGESPAHRLPAVLVVELGPGAEGPKVAPALVNGLKTLLALYALDEKHEGGRLRVESRPAAGTRIYTLNEATPFAFAVRDGRLVLGTTASAVAGALSAQADPHADARFERLRAAHFPGAESFACLDLRAIHEFADHQRPALTRRIAAEHHRTPQAAARDLDEILALLDLFEAAFLTSSIDPEFRHVHRTLGLVGRSPAGPTRP